jgi:hypothetical protein
MFWEVFHELPEEEKRKFLLFLTGSVRIPVQGMKAIKVFAYTYYSSLTKLEDELIWEMFIIQFINLHSVKLCIA